jgi:hypothetical protein
VAIGQADAQVVTVDAVPVRPPFDRPGRTVLGRGSAMVVIVCPATAGR